VSRSLKSSLFSIPDDNSFPMLRRVKVAAGSGPGPVLTAQILMLLYVYCYPSHFSERELYI